MHLLDFKNEDENNTSKFTDLPRERFHQQRILAVVSLVDGCQFFMLCLIGNLDIAYKVATTGVSRVRMVSQIRCVVV